MSLLASPVVSASRSPPGAAGASPQARGRARRGEGQTSEGEVSQRAGDHTGLSRGLLVRGGPIRSPRKLGKLTGYLEKAPGPSQARDSVNPENKAPRPPPEQPVCPSVVAVRAQGHQETRCNTCCSARPAGDSGSGSSRSVLIPHFCADCVYDVLQILEHAAQSAPVSLSDDCIISVLPGFASHRSVSRLRTASSRPHPWLQRWVAARSRNGQAVPVTSPFCLFGALCSPRLLCPHLPCSHASLPPAKDPCPGTHPPACAPHEDWRPLCCARIPAVYRHRPLRSAPPPLAAGGLASSVTAS